MYPKEDGHHGIIFEFKFTKSKDELEKKALEAIEQIKEKEYVKDMKSLGTEKIYLIGIAFSGKDIEVSWKI